MEQGWKVQMQTVLFAVIGIWMAIFCGILYCQSNAEVWRMRDSNHYVHISEIETTEVENADVSGGVIREYRFLVCEKNDHDAMAFYVSHANVEVELAGACVYRMTAADGRLRTYGSTWVQIPLHEADAGVEACVRLTPLYKNQKIKTPDVMIGTGVSIYRSILKQELPELILCLCVGFVGLLLFGVAVYYGIRKRGTRRLYAVSGLAISVSVWRFTYGRFSYLLLEQHTKLLYTVSVLALMVAAGALLHCAEVKRQPWTTRLVCVLSLCYCAIDIGQLFLQSLGIWDLKQMLAFTHLMIVVSAVLCFISGVMECVNGFRHAGNLAEGNFIWILGIGAMGDLLIYYFAGSSRGMILLQVTVLCFVILEGARLLVSYGKQKQTLSELETQLTLSQSMTLMSQIRSHFVFNILNAISGMCKYDPEKADETVVRFARYLRNNISIMEDDANIPFATELRRLEDYVILEQIRFGDKLEFYTEIETEDFSLPPLILQPVIENAIKHGISKKQSGGTIILRTQEVDDQIVITVEDDGVGFEESELAKKGSVGLNNIRFRLKHRANGTLTIQSVVGEGTVVTITIPKKFSGGEVRENECDLC